jgi:ribonuclease P/MRP protein subunit RPP1
MFIDLNIPTPTIPIHASAAPKKQKGKGSQQPLQAQIPAVTFTPAQLTAIESRLDVLEHCMQSYFIQSTLADSNRAVGYTVFALNQVIQKKIDAKTHVNTLDPLLDKLKKRTNITFLKRLTIVLDEESEKGFGLVSFA